jgi:hypothetical protein
MKSYTLYRFGDPQQGDAVTITVYETHFGTVAKVADTETRWWTSLRAVRASGRYEDESDAETLGYAAWCRACDARKWPVTGCGEYGIPDSHCSRNFFRAVKAALVEDRRNP